MRDKGRLSAGRGFSGYNSRMSKTWLGVSSLIIATLLYSCFGVLTKIAGFSLPLLFVTWIRNFLAAGILLLPLLLTRSFRWPQKTDWGWLVLRAIGGMIGFLGSYYAFYALPIGTAYFIFYGGSTIGGYIVGTALFKEKLTWLKLFSLAMAIIGLGLIYSVEIDPQLIKYVWLALIAGFGGAVWNTFSKKISTDYSATQLNGLDFFLGGIIALILSIGLRETWVAPSFSVPWLMVGLFLILFVVTGQLMITGFKYLDVHRGSLLMLLEVVFGVIVGALFYQEKLSVLGLVGGAMIIVSTALPELHALWSKPKSVR